MKIEIPGDPVAQGRPRFYRIGNGVRVVDPAKSRAWKKHAQTHMMQQYKQSPIESGTPVVIVVNVFFPCPKSDHRKRNPPKRRWHTKRPDLDNVIKAVKDAGTGFLWYDDSQIVEIHATKLICAQDESPRVEVRVRGLSCGVDEWGEEK